MSEKKSPFVWLHEQKAVWDEWKESLPKGGTLDTKERRLWEWNWNQRTQLDPDLWAYLVEWAKKR